MKIRAYKTVLLIVTMMMAACTMTADKPDNPTLTVVLPPQPPAVATPTVPDAPPTATSPAAQPANTNNNSEAPCIVRSDLMPYTVQPGDTLTSIANQALMQPNQLAQSNCLVDPDLLEVGQVLYVPQIPNPAVSFTLAGQVDVSPYVREEDGWIVLPADSTVTVSWVWEPEFVVRTISFYLLPPDNQSTAIILGRDDDLSNGGSLEWVVPANMQGYLTAVASFTGVVAAASAVPLPIRSE